MFICMYPHTDIIKNNKFKDNRRTDQSELVPLPISPKASATDKSVFSFVNKLEMHLCKRLLSEQTYR